MVGGTYNISGGSLTGGSLVLASTSATFNQTGGSVTGLLYAAAGTYRLAGGLLRVPSLIIPDSPDSAPPSFDATFLQTGGTNLCSGGLSVYRQYAPGFPQIGPGRYVLSNGVLQVTGGSGAGAGGDFQQWGGWHTNDSTGVSGYSGDPQGPRVASFTLGGGILSTRFVTMSDVSRFLQSGGTNFACEHVALEFFSTYTLTGGRLVTPRTSISPSASFIQSGGTTAQQHVSDCWQLPAGDQWLHS